eukprot:147720-Prymnesium_polylepis.1
MGIHKGKDVRAGEPGRKASGGADACRGTESRPGCRRSHGRALWPEHAFRNVPAALVGPGSDCWRSVPARR